MKKAINQEVGAINTTFLSMAHIVASNPIVHDSTEVKSEYLSRLGSYIRAAGWQKRKYEDAQMCAYREIIMQSEETQEKHDIDFYRHYILFDLLHIMAYDLKNSDKEKIESIKEKYYRDFSQMASQKQLVNQIFSSVKSCKKLKQLEENPALKLECEYIDLIEKNLRFKNKIPFNVMVTATMSAGKSTFINALTGKYICLSQNMACTSKIHTIVNKAYEDGYSYEYDHDLVMTAGSEELLNDNELNNSDRIVVGTNFIGGLQKQRIVINDSPGVNYSGDKEHKVITDKLIKSKNYNLLIYVMNATQLATNDEDEHLDFVRRTVGRKPVIFIINKIDTFNIDEEDVDAAIKNQIEYLKRKGFKNPIVCPVSARAGYLAKRFSVSELSRTEERELYNYVDKFEKMNLPAYYGKLFKKIRISNSEKEEEQLLKTSGLAYVEKIIASLATGGKVNGTGVC